jgi:hypothetical protein
MPREQGSQLESFIDAAIDSGMMSITESVSWERREGHLKARLNVDYSDHPGFRLELHHTPLLPRRFSLQLMYQRRTARRYCSSMPHTQPGDCTEFPNQRILGMHKHRWSDQTGDECVCVPSDISGGLIEETFYEFCTESGVSFLGVWHDPPGLQLGLETIA